MSSSWVYAAELSDQAPECVGLWTQQDDGSWEGRRKADGRDMLGLPCLPAGWDGGLMASGSICPLSGLEGTLGE